jgi:hypothetical protein
MRRSRNKLGNKKVVTPDGTFDSKREYERYCELCLLQKSGQIRDLKRQVEFPLIPAAREQIGVYQKGPRKGKPKYGKVIEHGVSYFADFVYVDVRTGEKIVEDAKGYRNPHSSTYQVFVIKRKLMLWLHGISVKEV